MLAAACRSCRYFCFVLRGFLWCRTGGKCYSVHHIIDPIRCIFIFPYIRYDYGGRDYFKIIFLSIYLYIYFANYSWSVYICLSICDPNILYVSPFPSSRLYFCLSSALFFDTFFIHLHANKHWMKINRSWEACQFTIVLLISTSVCDCQLRFSDIFQ